MGGREGGNGEGGREEQQAWKLALSQGREGRNAVSIKVSGVGLGGGSEG